MGMRAEDISHHTNQLQCSGVTHTVEDPVCIFAGGEYAFISQDGKVLGDIALGCAYLFYNILDASLLIAQCAKDLEA